MEDKRYEPDEKRLEFNDALNAAKEKYPYTINHYEEYEDYYVFDCDDGAEYVGGPQSPIVIRKSDLEAFSYSAIFFDFEEGAQEAIGEMLSEGVIE